MEKKGRSDEVNFRLIEGSPLRCLIAPPNADRAAGERLRPVLCFLHGYDEGAPARIKEALTRHGPLRPGNPVSVFSNFIVIAPQMPVRGDLWHRFADPVRQLARHVQVIYGGDPNATYLTGFSFGANGVFDLALLQRDFWAALWAVDPTRFPAHDPMRPVWLSFGQIARFGKENFINALHLLPAGNGGEWGDRVYLDQGADHVGSAARAYADERIYSWLLSKRLP